MTFSLAENIGTIDSTMLWELVAHIGLGVIGAYAILMAMLFFFLWSDYRDRKK